MQNKPRENGIPRGLFISCFQKSNQTLATASRPQWNGALLYANVASPLFLLRHIRVEA